MTTTIHNRVATAITAAVFIAATGLLGIQQAFAATNSMYLSASPSSLKSGDNVVVTVRITPGSGGADTAQVDLNYDSSKLGYVSSDYSSSPFGTQIGASNTSSRVSFTAVSLGTNVTADSLIAKVTFKALTGSGSSALTLDGSGAASAGNPSNPSLVGATVNFTTPVSTPPACPSGQVGTYPNCTTPPSTGGGTTPTPPTGTTPKPTPAPPVTSGSSKSSTSAGTSATSTKAVVSAGGVSPAVVTANQSKYTVASVTFTTKTPTEAYIRFGTNGQLLATTPVSDFSTTHTITLPASALLPGIQYDYVVVTTDKQGSVSTTSLQKLATKGLKISVTAVDKLGRKLKGVKITLHSTPQTATTDGSGQASFDDVAAGNHTVIYERDGKTYQQPIVVVNNVDDTTQTASAQHFSVTYGLVAATVNTRLIVWLSLAALIAVVIIVLAKSGRLGMAIRLRNNDAPLVTQPIVVGSGNASNIHPIQTGQELGDQAKREIDASLSTIPNPSQPSPGSMVAPQDTTPVIDKTGREV